VTPAVTDGFGIFAGTWCPDAAWEPLKSVISEDHGRAMARASFLQPARSSLAGEWAGFILEESPERAKEADIAVFPDSHLRGYSVTAGISADMPDAKATIYAAWDQVFTRGQAGVDVMGEVCRRIEAAQRQRPDEKPRRRVPIEFREV
jgi:hypothetical protein